MPYTRADIIKLYKQQFPQLASLSDNDVWRVAAANDNELALGISELQVPNQAPDARSAKDVALDQMDEVPKGVASLVTGVPGMVKSVVGAAVGGPKAQWELAKGAYEGITQPFRQSGKGAMELASPGSQGPEVNPSSQEWKTAAQGAGANLGGLVIPPALSTGKNLAAPFVKSGAKAVGNKLTSPTELRARAAKNVERAIGPKGIESKGAVQRIAPELAEKHLVRGATQKTIDQNLIDDFERSGDAVGLHEERLSNTNVKYDRQELIDEIVGAKEGLKIQGSDAIFDTVTAKALDEALEQVALLPGELNFRQMIDLRRKLDDAARKAGAFKEGTPPVDQVRADTLRSVSDQVRKRLNGTDSGLAEANHDYWLKRKAADVVKNRQLGDVGKVGDTLPGRGNLLDDMLASGIGKSVAGTPGMVVGEAINLGSQLPGFAAWKAGKQTKLAGFLEGPKTPAPKTLSGAQQDLFPHDTPKPTGPEIVSMQTPKPDAPKTLEGNQLGLFNPPGGQSKNIGENIFKVQQRNPRYRSSIEGNPSTPGSFIDESPVEGYTKSPEEFRPIHRGLGELAGPTKPVMGQEQFNMPGALTKVPEGQPGYTPPQTESYYPGKAGMVTDPGMRQVQRVNPETGLFEIVEEPNVHDYSNQQQLFGVGNTAPPPTRSLVVAEPQTVAPIPSEDIPHLNTVPTSRSNNAWEMPPVPRKPLALLPEEAGIANYYGQRQLSGLNRPITPDMPAESMREYLRRTGRNHLAGR